MRSFLVRVVGFPVRADVGLELWCRFPEVVQGRGGLEICPGFIGRTEKTSCPLSNDTVVCIKPEISDFSQLVVRIGLRVFVPRRMRDEW